MSWKDYTEFIRKDNVCDSAALLCVEDGSAVVNDNFNLSKYKLKIPTDDHRSTQTVTVDEALILKDISLFGKTRNPAGVRLSGIKY